jgi:hypothetical protein
MKGNFTDWVEFISACIGIFSNLVILFFLGLIIYIEYDDPNDVINGNPIIVFSITSVLFLLFTALLIWLLKKYIFVNNENKIAD